MVSCKLTSLLIVNIIFGNLYVIKWWGTSHVPGDGESISITLYNPSLSVALSY